MNTNNLAIQTQTYGANDRVEATTSTTSMSMSSTSPTKQVVLRHGPYITRRSWRPVKVPVLKRRTGHEKESKATARSIKESWTCTGGTEDVPLVMAPKPTPSFLRRLDKGQETVAYISENLQTSTPSVPTNIEDLFTWEDFVGSGSSAENQDAHTIPLPQLMLVQDSQHPAGTAVSFAAPDSYTNLQVNSLDLNLSTPTLAQSTGISFPLQPRRDDPPYFSDADLSSHDSTSSLPSTPGFPTPILHLPMGKGPEEDLLGHASTSGPIGGNYLPYSYAAQLRQPSIGEGTQWYRQHCAKEPSFLGTETVAGQGAEWMGAMTVEASSSYVLPRESKGRKRERSEMGDADEESTAGPARQKLRSDRSLGVKVPRGSAFMAGQQQGLEPLHNNQLKGMGAQCDGEGRPLNLAKTFSFGHREG